MPIINLSLAEDKILFYSDEVLTKYKMILLIISLLNKPIAVLSFI